MKKTIHIMAFIIFTSCGVQKLLGSLNKINRQVEKIDNSSKLKTQSYDLIELYKRKEGTFEIGKINNKLQKITIESEDYNVFQKTTIYLQKEKPILVRKEAKATLTAYLTNGDIETDDLKYQTDFYVIDWQNKVYEKKKFTKNIYQRRKLSVKRRLKNL